MEKCRVHIVGRIVEGTSMEIEPIEYYLDYKTKEEAIKQIKEDLVETFNKWHGDSFDGHDDADYDIEEFENALDEFDWDIPIDDRSAEAE